MDYPLSVFISSDAVGMDAERKTVEAAIQAIPIRQPWLFEFSPKTVLALAESYLSKVRGCDIFVLLLTDSITDLVKLEVETAQSGSKAMLVFLNETAPESVVEYTRSLGVKRTTFDNLDRLSNKVATELSEELITGYRRYKLSNDDLRAVSEFMEQIDLDDMWMSSKIRGNATAIGGDVHDGIIQRDDSIQVGRPVLIVGVGGSGTNMVISEMPVKMTAVKRESALGRYLQNVISRNRYLQLQGIRSGGKLVHIELDRTYIRLRSTLQRAVVAENLWLANDASLAPNEQNNKQSERVTTIDVVTVPVEEVLAHAQRLVVLGDPGSGKTTLLRYLALLYARDMAEGTSLVQEKLSLDDQGHLPILVPLRQLGAFLRSLKVGGSATRDHVVIHSYLIRSLKNAGIELPDGFFEPWLIEGRAIVLLDGLDEVVDPDLRQRVSRLIEAFTCAYPNCRYVITSRIVGYTGAARLGEDYATTTVRDFNMADVERFLQNWHRLIAIGQMGAGTSAETYASEQTRQLKEAIEANERIRELAINPLMLTVIATVHRDRVKLPDRRAELYAEAVDVLLGKWEEAKGMSEIVILESEPFDTGDRRLMLQSIALNMHEAEQKEVSAETLKSWLGEMFFAILGEWRAVDRVVERFIQVIEERTGLLVARGEGVYAFSHLTFQEYLAAQAVTARDDYIPYTLARSPDPWWREVILLEAGYLSMQSRERTAKLIQAIADCQEEPQPYYNLVLAAECLHTVGTGRVPGDMMLEIQHRLRRQIELPRPTLSRWLNIGTKNWLVMRGQAVNALAQIGAGFWVQPYGEPEWINVPTGEFWMGHNEKMQKAFLDEYNIASVPITNAQYLRFVRYTGHQAPAFWQDGLPPKGQESHPVVGVDWYDANGYCQWMSKITGTHIALPSEAQWEKAARGSSDKRTFPWGNAFDINQCNSADSSLFGTTPVGIYPGGASPYGCLDMVGNVWEWTATLAQSRVEHLGRIARGGSWNEYQNNTNCTARLQIAFDDAREDLGFRIVSVQVESTLLDEAVEFFQQADFVVNHMDRVLGELIVFSDKWATHTKFGDILLKVIPGDVTAEHLRRIQSGIESRAVQSELTYVVYGGVLTDDAFWQMGTFKLEKGLTIIPLRADLLREALTTLPANCYAKLRAVEQDFVGGKANPYEQSNAISDPTWFFGRRSEAEEIMNRLKSGQHAGIFGMRKIGKTSLLLYLRRSLGRNAIPVAYLGMQSNLLEPTMLFREVIQQFRAFLEGMGVNKIPDSTILSRQPNTRSGAMFSEDVLALWHVAKAELDAPLMVLMIDEAERIVPYPGSSKEVYRQYDEFFAPIRDLSQNQRCLVTVVTAERPSIIEEFAETQLSNVMFQLYDERYLGAFSTEEMNEMVVQIGKWMGLQYSTDSLQSIASESGCHPYVARALCACIAKNVQIGQVSKEDVDSAIDYSLDTLHFYFAGWWMKQQREIQAIVTKILMEPALPRHHYRNRTRCLTLPS